jgi:hypothetical protein
MEWLGLFERLKEESKRFFFEKKNQKTFATLTLFMRNRFSDIVQILLRMASRLRKRLKEA